MQIKLLMSLDGEATYFLSAVYRRYDGPARKAGVLFETPFVVGGSDVYDHTQFLRWLVEDPCKGRELFRSFLEITYEQNELGNVCLISISLSEYLQAAMAGNTSLRDKYIDAVKYMLSCACSADIELIIPDLFMLFALKSPLLSANTFDSSAINLVNREFYSAVRRIVDLAPSVKPYATVKTGPASAAELEHVLLADLVRAGVTMDQRDLEDVYPVWRWNPLTWVIALRSGASKPHNVGLGHRRQFAVSPPGPVLTRSSAASLYEKWRAGNASYAQDIEERSTPVSVPKPENLYNQLAFLYASSQGSAADVELVPGALQFELVVAQQVVANMGASVAK